MNIIDELTWRGAINQQTNAEGLYKLVSGKSISLYCGIDPTGDSMHIGHLIPFMILKRFQLAGHHPYMLIGGATGEIRDPSGKKSERTDAEVKEQVKKNFVIQRAAIDVKEKYYEQFAEFLNGEQLEKLFNPFPNQGMRPNNRPQRERPQFDNGQPPMPEW